MVLMLLAIDATGHLFAWTATRRKDGWAFFWVSLGWLRIYSLCRSRSKIRPNDFLAWAGGRLTHCAFTSHVRSRRGISVSRWLRELAMAYLRVLSGLVGFSKT